MLKKTERKKIINMANEVFVSVDENLSEPKWFNSVEKFVQRVLEKLSKDKVELSVLFCDDDYMKELNLQYRNIDSSTDILSFETESDSDFLDIPLENETNLLENCYIGDIAISLDMLKVNAEYFGVTEMEELQRLLIHGVLHLCGYDHGEEHIEKGVEPDCEMLKLQEKLLCEFLPEKIIKEE